MRNITIGYIPVIEIQKQINTATLRLLQRYSEVLGTNDAKAVEDFLFDASQKNNSNRMDLHGNGFKVSACVLALSLQYQYSAVNLIRVIEYGLRNADGFEIKCCLSDDEKTIEFWYED